MSLNKTYDVVVFGATGFTGYFISEYIAKRSKGPELNAEHEFKWAICGRSLEKLKELKARLEKATTLTLDNLSLEVADAGEQNAVDAVVAKTRVVISAAGPFQKFGTPVVDACVRLKADYVDITGEKPNEGQRDDFGRTVKACGKMEV